MTTAEGDEPGATVQVLRAQVPLELAGQRFDQALVALFGQHSRSRLSAWVREGRATLDGVVVKPRQLVCGGEQVEVHAQSAPSDRVAPESIALEVLHRDAQVFVINKPPGLVVHPGAGNRTGTLQNALLALDAELARVPRAGIVHRLDKDTSGALVVARTVEAHTRLVAQLSQREVSRRYLALVQGVLISGATVRAPLGRHPRERLKMAVREDGREAVTHYRVRERFRSHTLLQVELETGRTHQIRVHLAHVKRALVGDQLYGTGLKLPKGASEELVATLRGFKRQALHAERLAFAHPKSGKEIAVEAPLPADLASLLVALRRDAAAEAAQQRARR